MKKDNKNNDNYNYNKKRNKLFVLFFSISLILIFSIILFVTNYNDKKDKNENKIDKIVESSEKYKNLPDLIDVDSLTTPILYDFINSSISYHENIPNIKDFGFFYAILQNNDNPKYETYIEYYTYGEKMIRPTIGNKYKNMNLNQSEADAIKDFGSKIPEDLNRKFNENSKWGNWTLYIISEYSINPKIDKYYSCTAERWAGMRLKDFIDQSKDDFKSPMYNFVFEKGNGYPLEWLQKEPYKEILYKDGYDVDDEFWSKYPIDSFKIYKNKNDESNTIKVYTEQIDRFKFDYRGNTLRLKEDELKNFMEINEFESF